MEAIGTLASSIAHDFNSHPRHHRLRRAGPGRHARRLRRRLPSPRGHGRPAAGQAGRATDPRFSRQSPPQRQRIRLGAIVEEVVNLLQATLPSTIVIRREITADQDEAVADPAQIHQVLLNLGTDASHAMAARGAASCSSGWRACPSGIPGRPPSSPCRVAAISSSRSRIAAMGSVPRSCGGSSSRSSPPSPSGKAPASASRSSTASSRATAATSTWRACREPGPPSSSTCPSPTTAPAPLNPHGPYPHHRRRREHARLAVPYPGAARAPGLRLPRRQGRGGPRRRESARPRDHRPHHAREGGTRDHHGAARAPPPDPDHRHVGRRTPEQRRLSPPGEKVRRRHHPIASPSPATS